MFINSLSIVINPLYHDCNLLKRQLKHHVALRLLYLCIVITEKQVLQTDEQTKPKNKFINRLNSKKVMALNYEVKKKVFGFDQTKTEKYVAQLKTLGIIQFGDLCDEVTKIGMAPVVW